LKSSIDPPANLAIARVKEFLASDSILICTARGSALDELDPPFEAKLFFPEEKAVPGSFEDLMPSFDGPGTGRYRSVVVTEIRRRRQQFIVRVQLFEPSDPAGAWLCIDRRLLDQNDGLYFYRLKGMPVRRSHDGETVAVVYDYMETAAHGILIVRRVDSGEDVYLPLHDEHVKLDLKNRECIVPGFDDFL
jgi:ribosomal 30S subunit maturation factor RimM